MKVVFVSNLFPDSAEPYRGLDNSSLLQHLAHYCEIRVVSPRPSLLWKKSPVRLSRPVDEQFKPVYPKTFYVPKIGSAVNHLLFANAIHEPLQALQKHFPFDVILCSWVYPDGCAVARVARRLNRPFVLIAQGSDIHIYLQMAFRRRLICDAANQSRGLITRSGKLAELLRESGVAAEKLHPIYNGVDLKTFHPGNRAAARTELGFPTNANVILFVGNFLEIKNPLLLVSAHAELCRREPGKNFHLVMIGDGPLRATTRRAADASGLGKVVSLVGRKQPAEIARWMQAADLLCISSDNEGVPNVVLEAFACGLRVISTRVGGIHEVLKEDFLGCLVEKRNLSELVEALQQTLVKKSDPDAIRNYALRFSWERTTAAYFEILKNCFAGKNQAVTN